MDSNKLTKDPIHGYIKFENWVIQFIDTPQFQRLRDIKQLGTAFYVFPGATHTRFEHSLGTAYLAYNLTKRLQEQQGKNNDDERNLKCVTLAALCHDLGHGPYSHLFDRDFIKDSLGINWKHEEGSITMFQDLLDKNPIDFESMGLEKPDDVEIIKALIKGDPKSLTLTESTRNIPKYLFNIVNNGENSLDVDKFDYFARDCYYSGAKIQFDFQRLMQLSRVMDDEIVYYYKECYLIYELFHTRYSLHKTVYKHRVVRAIDHMICDALKHAQKYLEKKFEVEKFDDLINNGEKYIQLSDSIFYEIEYSKDKELTGSKEIIEQIKKRKLYKLVDEFLTEKKEDSEKKKINEKIINCIKNVDHNDIIIDWLSFDYGKKDKNPVKFVKFYDFDDDKKPFQVKKIKKEDVSYFLPTVYKEEIVRIYLRTKKNDKKDELKIKIKEIKTAFRAKAKDLKLINEEEEESNSESEKDEKGRKPSISDETSQRKKSKNEK
ncbi:HD phosphohydrolase domain-containing protein [Gigaspora margarita]|uniref:HD phosphohydrolase domain-containing protein n=1 Tax=Gigaspora margarita TaxID=4874 RepID=A0A8H4AS12_GIGMA|nr:HD phosphohydrolase domain-containing protein [Gigaspora margarita]